jgi:hypothetical protein
MLENIEKINQDVNSLDGNINQKIFNLDRE